MSHSQCSEVLVVPSVMPFRMPVLCTLQEVANQILALPHLPRVEHQVPLLRKAFNLVPD